MLDLRGAEPKYVFARVNYLGDETREGRTFEHQSTIGAYLICHEWFSSESRSLI